MLELVHNHQASPCPEHGSPESSPSPRVAGGRVLLQDAVTRGMIVQSTIIGVMIVIFVILAVLAWLCRRRLLFARRRSVHRSPRRSIARGRRPIPSIPPEDDFDALDVVVYDGQLVPERDSFDLDRIEYQFEPEFVVPEECEDTYPPERPPPLAVAAPRTPILSTPVPERGEIDPAVTCPICFELYSVPESRPASLLPCGHVLCLPCLRRLPPAGLQVPEAPYSRLCPMCRSPFRARDVRAARVAAAAAAAAAAEVGAERTKGGEEEEEARRAERPAISVLAIETEPAVSAT
eukprot:tig00000057_g38.t1